MNKTDGCDQICTNLLGGYNCSCYTGYYLKNKTHCIDSDECTSNTHNCSSMASCTNTPGLFNCTCKSGLTGNGTYCQGNLKLYHTQLMSTLRTPGLPNTVQ